MCVCVRDVRDVVRDVRDVCVCVRDVRDVRDVFLRAIIILHCAKMTFQVANLTARHFSKPRHYGLFHKNASL